MKDAPRPAPPRGAGVVLSALFFYPIVAAADAQALFLHWQGADTVELLVSFVSLALVAELILRGAARLTSDRVAFVMCSATLALPITSFLTGVLRGLPIKDAFIAFAASRWVWIAFGLFGAAVVGFVVTRTPRVALRMIRLMLLMLVPLTLLVLAGVWRLAAPGFQGSNVPRFQSSEVPGFLEPWNPGHVLILIFDELSYSRMYVDREILPDLPHLRALGATARHYHVATAPGAETMESMPGYFNGQRYHDVDVKGLAVLEVAPTGERRPLAFDGDDSLLRVVRAEGFRTEIFGYYYPYCELLPGLWDACRQYSFYNASSVDDRFSPFAAIRTTFILWPYQFPTGIIKNSAFGSHQRDVAIALEAHASAALTVPTVRLVHFNIPHAPFVFRRDGYAPPSDPLSDREDHYRHQLEYVDAVVGRLTQRLGLAAPAARSPWS